MTRLAAGNSLLKELMLLDTKIADDLDPNIVARAFSSLQSLEIHGGDGSFSTYTANLFRAFSSPDSKLLELGLDFPSAVHLRVMPPGHPPGGAH